MQNWDYRPRVEWHTVVAFVDNGAELHITEVTETGQSMRNRMNNSGIGLCVNNLTSVLDTGEVGAPVIFVRRKVLNSRSSEEVCENVRNSKKGVSCNFMPANTEGAGVDPEATLGGVFEVFPENNIITHVNHMVAGHVFCTNQSIKFRDEVLRRRLEKYGGQLDIYRIQQCLRDHGTLPDAPDTYPEGNCIEAVCNHTPHGDHGEDKVRRTISSPVYGLDRKTAYICKGCPREGTYVLYKVQRLKVRRGKMTGRVGLEKPQDCVVVVSLRGTGGIALQLHGEQKSMFGDTVRACARARLEELGVKNAAVEIQDFGSLDFAIRVRLKTAADRARRANHEQGTHGTVLPSQSTENVSQRTGVPP